LIGGTKTKSSRYYTSQLYPRKGGGDTDRLIVPISRGILPQKR